MILLLAVALLSVVFTMIRVSNIGIYLTTIVLVMFLLHQAAEVRQQHGHTGHTKHHISKTRR